MIRSKKILNSARDQPCTMRVLGICNHDPATTVAAHITLKGRGVAMKPDDTDIVYACSDCHAVMDGHRQSDEYAQNRFFYLLRGHLETMRRLIENEVLS